MDVGTGSTTSFKGDSSIATLVEEYPEIGDLIFDKGYRILQCKMHSHVNFNCFYSGTDQSDLEEGSRNQDVYLSLVCNNKLEFFGKACRWAKEETDNVEILVNGRYQKHTYRIPPIVQSVNVKLESNLPAWFTKRLEEVKQVPVVQKFGTYNYGKGGTQYEFNDGETGWYPNTTPAWKNTNWTNVPVKEEEEFTFEDELKQVFGIQKTIPSIWLKKNKVDLAAMIQNLQTYSVKEEDDFFDALGEWIVENDLTESKFGHQMKVYLKTIVE